MGAVSVWECWGLGCIGLRWEARCRVDALSNDPSAEGRRLATHHLHSAVRADPCVDVRMDACADMPLGNLAQVGKL